MKIWIKAYLKRPVSFASDRNHVLLSCLNFTIIFLNKNRHGLFDDHVVPGTVKSTDLKNGMYAKTVQGGDIKVSLYGSKVSINDAGVTSADILASNGVVHVIDKVILPPEK